jgi:Secretion system C-terminal sorting domain
MKTKLLSILILACFFCPAWGQTFLNGSFETNTALINRFNISNAAFTGFMANSVGFGGNNGLDIQNNTSTYAPAQSGSWFVSLEYTASGDAFTMALSTPLISGNTYYLCYYDKGMDVSGCCPPSAALQIGISTVNNATGTIVYTSPIPTLGVWTQRIFSFVAPNNGQFVSVNMPAWRWTLVDNFVLSLTAGCVPIVLDAQSLEISVQQPSSNYNQIDWLTTGEDQIQSFMVERSFNGVEFVSVGEAIQPQGASGNHSYSLPDYDFQSGVNYYRIRIVNADGSFTYSKIVSVLNSGNETPLGIIPNPNTGNFHLNHGFDQNDQNPVTLSIYNAEGMKVAEFIQSPMWFYEEELQLNFLTQGAYIAVLQNEEKVATAKFIIAR